MARITVEDCLEQVDNHNRFHLSLMASRRARQLKHGATPLIQSDEDNFAVLALREFATGRLTPEFLEQVDDELEGAHLPGEPRPGGESESVAEAAAALGADMAAGMEGGGSDAPEGGEEEAAPEEPRLADDAGEDTPGEEEDSLHEGPDDGGLGEGGSPEEE